MVAKSKVAKPVPAKSLTVSRQQLLVDGSDQVFRRFVHDMLAFAARIQETRSRLAHVIGLSGSRYTILISIAHLQDQDGGVGINRVAEHLHLSGAFVTIETKQLLEAGLVTKKTNMTDRRRVLLSITPKARRLLETLTAVQRPVNDELFGCLSAKDFAALRGITARLVEGGDRALALLDSLGWNDASRPATAKGR